MAGSQGGTVIFQSGEEKQKGCLLKKGDSEQQNVARGGTVTAEQFRRPAAPTIGSEIVLRKSPWIKPIKYL